MRRLARSTLAAAGLALLGGCGPLNQSLEPVHQPLVTRTDYVFDVAGDGYGGLAPGEAKRVAAWFDGIGLAYGDRIAVDGPYGRQAIAALAGARGMLLSTSAPVTAGQVAPGAIRVVVSRSVASVAGCPDWQRPSQPEFQASTMSNYGCATNLNLAASIADPQDLIAGQSAPMGGDAVTTAKAIKAFRDKPATAAPLRRESTGGASGGMN